jgi:hypothetical protein
VAGRCGADAGEHRADQRPVKIVLCFHVNDEIPFNSIDTAPGCSCICALRGRPGLPLHDERSPLFRTAGGAHHEVIIGPVVKGAFPTRRQTCGCGARKMNWPRKEKTLRFQTSQDKQPP